MKNSLFQDLMHEMRNRLRKHHGFSVEHGGFLSKEQKEKMKIDFSEAIDLLPEYNGNGYKFPEKRE